MATTIETEIVTDIHPDAIICPDCGHDCDLMDCGDICICIEEVEEDSWDEYAAEQQAAYNDYWGDPLDDFPSYGD